MTGAGQTALPTPAQDELMAEVMRLVLSSTDSGMPISQAVTALQFVSGGVAALAGVDLVGCPHHQQIAMQNMLTGHQAGLDAVTCVDATQ